MAIDETSERLHAENARLRARIATLEARADASKPHWFDFANDALFVTDATWHITDWNEMAELLYGWPRAEVIGRSTWDVIPPVRYLDGATDDSATETLLHQGVWRGVFVQRTRAGDELVIEGSIRAIVDDDCAISGYIAINRDITARVQSEAALKASEETLRIVTEAAGIGLALIDADYHYRYSNQTHKDYLGRQDADLAERRVADMLGPLYEPLIQQRLEHALQGESVSGPLELPITPDAEKRHYEVRIERSATSVKPMAVVVLIDVTERVTAEAGLRASEERFRAIIENGVEGIVLIDANRHPRYVSPTITTLLGYPPTTFATLRASDLCHPDDLPQFNAFITTLTTSSDATAEVTARLHHQDGSWRWMELHGIDQIGNPAVAAIIISLHDVNERVAAEAALAAEHQRIVQLKNAFLATMSHELRTPLNAVIGHSQLLIEEIYGALSERQHGAVHSIDASGRHLLVLINDILDYTKFESGKLALGIDMTAVPSLCYGCVRMIAASARQKKIRIVTVIDSAVSIIQADGKRLQQILLNLLVNAVKFTPEGGEIGLEVHGDAANQQVVFTVWDTGIGIAAVDFPQLF